MSEAQDLVGRSQRQPVTYKTIEEGKAPVNRMRKPSFTRTGNSVVTTASVLVANSVGAGLLSMHSAIAPFGWLVGSLLICILLAIHVHLCVVIWRMQMHFIAEAQIDSLGALVDQVFSRCSDRQRVAMVRTARNLQSVFVFFILSAGATSFGKGLGMLFYDVHVCFPYWVIVGMVALLPIHYCTRSLDSFAKLVFVNGVVILIALIIPLGAFAKQGVAWTRPTGSPMNAVESNTSIMGALSSFNIMTVNFVMQHLVSETVSEMREPHKFPLAIWGVTYPFLASMFLLSGVAGYFFLGGHSGGLLLGHVPFDMSLRLASLCLVFFVITGYLVKSIVLCKTIHKAIDDAGFSSETRKSWCTWGAIVTGVSVAAWLVSQIVPFFTPFMGLIGAFFAPMVCILLPILMHVIWVRDFQPFKDRGLFGKAENALLVFYFAIGCIVLVIGTTEAVSTILAGWSTSGSPFACHCDRLWNTCGCSASKLGPFLCPQALKGQAPVAYAPKLTNITRNVVEFTDHVRRMHTWEF